MKSVAIIGDLRLHTVFTPADGVLDLVSHLDQHADRKQFRWIHGGAVLTSKIVEDALKHVHPHPKLLAYRDDEISSLGLGPEFHVYWHATPHSWPGEKQSRYRLSQPVQIPIPKLSNRDLITIPFPQSILQELKNAKPEIDILAINDLSTLFRSIPLQTPESFLKSVRELLSERQSVTANLLLSQDAEEMLACAKSSATLTPSDSSGLAELCFDLASKPISMRSPWNAAKPEQTEARVKINSIVHGLRKAAYGFALHRILASMTDRIAQTPNLPALAPLLIVSINSPLPSLGAGTSPRVGSLPFWNHILTSDSLRERTIVVLNADELRADGVAISEALSWERCAHDLLKGIDTHAKLRPFRNCGHIIVRLGVSGALHLYNDPNAGQLCDIYFDPLHDDAAFTATKEGGGFILGYQSLFVASLVQSISMGCHRSEGGYLPTSLTPAISTAIRHAITRCQVLCKFGYGTSPEDVEHLFSFQEHPSGTSMMPSALLFHPVHLHYNANESKKFAGLLPQAAIGRSRVPHPMFDSWSIAAESVKSSTIPLADNLVNYGIPTTLNQPCWNVDDFLDAILATLQEMPTERRPSSEAVNNIPDSSLSSELGPIYLQLEMEIGWLLLIYHNKPDRFENVFGPVLGSVIHGIIDRSALDIDSVVKHTWMTLCGSKISESIVAGGVPRIRLAMLSLLLNIPTPPLKGLLETESQGSPAPLAYFGKESELVFRPMVVLDRRELEGIRFIRNLLDEHIHFVKSHDSPKPLSIAVFGPPGSGKSFAVKEVVKSVTAGVPGIEIEWVMVNLSEKTDPSQVKEDFDKITNAMALNKIPIAFFDEFDSRLGQDELGWLKFFLAPMEDGTFNGRSVGKAIFVFAGGTAETFRAFSRQDRAKIEPQWLEFTKAKGPDFVSRLRGHLDVVGINRSGPADGLYLIRRAISLRKCLEEMQKIDPSGVARIDSEVLRGLINVPEYKHGNRSLRNFLGLFRHRRESITRSAIPLMAQADMHVDAQAFWDLVTELQ